MKFKVKFSENFFNVDSPKREIDWKNLNQISSVILAVPEN